MDVRAAIATAAGKPLEVATVQIEGPREGEVLVEIKATGVCHNGEFTLSGADPEGLFPAILGHEGAGVVVDTGRGVTAVSSTPQSLGSIATSLEYWIVRRSLSSGRRRRDPVAGDDSGIRFKTSAPSAAQTPRHP